MRSIWTMRVAIAAMLSAAAMPVYAQGKSKGKGTEKKNEKPVVVTTTSKGEVASAAKSANRGDKATAAAKGPKRVTTSQAVIVTRDVLVRNGYQIVNVVPSGTTQVIYYRRGNMGRGRGLGPVEKIYVVPSGEVVAFRSVPDALLSTILKRLGM
jgi:hypothetical protein